MASSARRSALRPRQATTPGDEACGRYDRPSTRFHLHGLGACNAYNRTFRLKRHRRGSRNDASTSDIEARNESHRSDTQSCRYGLHSSIDTGSSSQEALRSARAGPLLAAAHLREPRPHDGRKRIQRRSDDGPRQKHVSRFCLRAHGVMASVAESVTSRALGVKPQLRVIEGGNSRDIREPLDEATSEDGKNVATA